MTHPSIARLVALSSALPLLVGMTACVPNKAAAETISVVSTATECKVSSAQASAGAVNFTVKNSGDKTTEFYVLAGDGLRVVGEVENIGPGITRPLTILVEAGTYYTVCKPGMTGAGLGNAVFTVTPSESGVALPADVEAAVATAATNYASYVRNQTDSLVSGTASFVQAYSAGRLDEARALYAPTRVFWERIETVAESFGDLDPKLDAREADLEPGQEWTGWHAIEKDLWPQDAESSFVAYSVSKRQSLAQGLVADTASLARRVVGISFTLTDLTNGAIGLLDEVATGKVTGEEEIWSHTDLWDFQANVDGARVLFEGVRPILVAKKSELVDQLNTEFAALQRLLDGHKSGSGFVLYTELTPAQVRTLSDEVNALAEKLNLLTAEVLK